MWFNYLILQKVYRPTHKHFIWALFSRSKKMPYSIAATSHGDKVWYLVYVSTNQRIYVWSFLTNSYSLQSIFPFLSLTGSYMDKIYFMQHEILWSWDMKIQHGTTLPHPITYLLIFQACFRWPLNWWRWHMTRDPPQWISWYHWHVKWCSSKIKNTAVT